MKPFYSLLLFVLLVGLVTSCATKDTATPPAELQNFASEARIKNQWVAQIGGSSSQVGFTLQPIVNEQGIFTSAVNGTLSQLSLQNGERLQSRDSNDTITAGFGAYADKLFYGTNNGDLVAIKQTDLSEVWRVSLRSGILAAPVVSVGIVVTRTIDGTVQAFNANTGEKRWSHKMNVPALSLHGNGQPVFIEPQVLIVGSDAGRLIALGADKGRILFETPLALSNGPNVIARLADIDMTPSYDKGILFISAYQNGLSAIDLQQGKLVWKHPASTFTRVAVNEDRVYITDSDSIVWAIDRANGETIWKQEGLLARTVSAPLMYKGKIVLVDFEGYVHVLSDADGRFVARQKINSDGYLSAPFVADMQQDTFYIAGKDGKLSALDVHFE